MKLSKFKVRKAVLFVVAFIMLATSALASAETLIPEGYKGGRQQGILIGSEGERIGTAEYWNRRNHFHV